MLNPQNQLLPLFGKTHPLLTIARIMSLESNDMIIDADTTQNEVRTETACAERKKENLIKGFRSVIHEAASRPKASIFFIGSPGRGKEKDVIFNSLATSGITNKNKDELGFGEFLEACGWCEAKLAPDSDVYMYG